MRLVPIDNIREDCTLGKTIYDDKGRVLLAKGVILKRSLTSKLKELGYNSLYIKDSFSSNEIEDIVRPQIRQKAIGTINQIMSDMEKLANEDMSTNLLKQVALGTNKSIASLKQISNEIVDELIVQKDIMISLVDIKSKDTYTFSHSVNVAVLSLVLGISLGLNRFELYDLSMGALLHDIGVIFVPKEKIHNRNNLTGEELKQYQLHTQKGYEHLGKIGQINSIVKVIALQHHEQIDGKGFPLGFTGAQINRFAKIVSVVDAYDLHTSNIDCDIPIPPHEAIEYIMANCGSKFDFDIAKEFIKKIIPYPVGTMVKLSNNSIGIVDKVNPDFPLRPIVKIVKESCIDHEINLMNANDIVISGIHYSF